jgi:hypothetical protein
MPPAKNFGILQPSPDWVREKGSDEKITQTRKRIKS